MLNGEEVESEMELARRDGTVGRYWAYRMPHRRDGRIAGYFFCATDISELTLARRRALELDAALDELGRLESALATPTQRGADTATVEPAADATGLEQRLRWLAARIGEALGPATEEGSAPGSWHPTPGRS